MDPDGIAAVLCVATATDPVADVRTVKFGGALQASSFLPAGGLGDERKEGWEFDFHQLHFLGLAWICFCMCSHVLTSKKGLYDTKKIWALSAQNNIFQRFLL